MTAASPLLALAGESACPTKLFQQTKSLRQLARGSAWNLLANVWINGAAVLGAVIAARQLGPESFGKFGIINTTIGMATTLAALGVGTTANKYIAEHRESDPARARRLLDLTMLVGFLAGLIGAAAMFFFAGPLALYGLHAAALAPELRLSAPMVFASVLGGAQVGILSGFERFRSLAKVNLVRAIVTVPLTAILIAAWGLRGAILSLTAAAMCGLIASSIALRRAIPAGFPPADYLRCRSEWRMLTMFSLPSLLTTIAFTPVQWAMAAWLVSAPNGFIEMGIYAAGNQIRTLVTYLPSALGQPALAMLSRESADPGRFRRLFRQTLLLAAGLAALVAFPVLIGSPWVLAIYHPGLKGHSAALSLLVLSGAMQVPGWIATVAVSSIGRMWTCALLQAMWAAATLIPAWWLIPQMGALGLAGSLLIGYSVHTAASLLVARGAQ